MTTPAPNLAREVKLLVAQHIIRSVNGITVDSEYLASVIQEITPETQIAGTSLLHLYLIDPYWIVQRSGLLDIDPATGELAHDVDVNFPEGSDLWWRLAMVDGGNDLSNANLELTFIDRTVAYMQDDWGPLGVSPGTTTRAQFIKQLVDRIPRVLHVQPIKFVCPELNVLQPVASSTTNSLGTTIVQNATTASTAANKAKGLGAGAAITVKGSPINPVQIQNVNTALGEATALNADQISMIALMYAAMGESSIGADAGTYSPNSAGYWGVFQGAVSQWPNPHDVAGQAQAFLTGAGPQGQTDFHTGAINWVKQGLNNPAQIAIQTEVPSIWPSDAYAAEWPGGSAQGLREALAIVNAYGGASLPSTTTGGTSTSDVSQLTRGTPQNPDEDSWTCGQRLASEVNWNLFSNGDYMYYMDGPDLISQKPALYLTLGDDGVTWTATNPTSGQKKSSSSVKQIITGLAYTVDDTAFKYESTHVRRGRVQRKTAIRKPQTASQLKLNLVCGIFEFSAGEVFVFQNAGAINGRWIVEDTTRNAFADDFTQFTFGPSVVPYPEPQASSTSATPTTTPSLATPATGATGSAGAASVALQALARQQSSHCFNYSQQRPIQYGILTDNPVNIDCSGFVIACYKAAGLSDPSGNGYNGQGFTGDMITGCVQIPAGQAQPGDMCFFGSSAFATTHVNIYVGNGQSVSMGQQGDPSEGPAAQMGPSGFLGYYRSNVVQPATVPTPTTTAPTTTGTALGGAGATATKIPPGGIGTAGGALLIPGIDNWLFGGFTG